MAVVKDLAKELGVSQQAIRAWCLRKQVAKDAQGRWIIDSDVEQAIRKHYASKTTQVAQAEAQDVAQVAQDVALKVEQELRAQIAELKRDKENLERLNDELLRSLQAEQALHAQANAKLLEARNEKKRGFFARLFGE